MQAYIHAFVNEADEITVEDYTATNSSAVRFGLGCSLFITPRHEARLRAILNERAVAADPFNPTTDALGIVPRAANEVA